MLSILNQLNRHWRLESFALYSSVRIYGFFVMNSSEQDSEWPDNYEVEITEAHRFSDGSFNETNNNGTLTFQGK